MIISWDGPNSLGYTPKFDRYFPEIKGFQGSSVFQTEPSTTEVNGINYVGPRAAYKASNAAGLLTISNYVAGLSNFGVTCRVLLRRGGVVVGRAQLDVPFGTNLFRVLQSPTSVSVNGSATQQYFLETSDTLLPGSWQPYGDGLPVFGGVAVSKNQSQSMKFFRAVQKGPQ